MAWKTYAAWGMSMSGWVKSKTSRLGKTGRLNQAPVEEFRVRIVDGCNTDDAYHCTWRTRV